jgi:hypothetical protein
MESTNRVLIEATLLRGARGLVEAVRQAHIPAETNLLVVVDQFEELFRFRKDASLSGSRDDAVAFVKMLLEASQAADVPIYIALTMRADFIGDCMAFPGLPEAVNAGQFLIPKMTRDELRSAITGPVAVGGGKIAGRLVLRLLNDFGDEYEQLPILQHALMRTWEHWEQRGYEGELDVGDYEAIGTLRHALSMHADEAYEETGSEQSKRLTERIFKALTDTFTDSRGTRRPTSVGVLAAICEVPASDVIRIVEIFRWPGRSFLMPPSDVSLEPQTVVDLSHESLMWCWVRLADWAEQEKASADVYSRLSDAAQWYSRGRGGLWRNPELEVAKNWRAENRPNAAWARRYDAHFAEAMEFLDRSEAEWERISAETKRARQKKLQQARLLAGLFGFLFLVAVLLAAYSWRQRQRAQANLELAKRAVDESLSAAGREQAREDSDLPQMEQFRKELLAKAATFYGLMARQNPSTTELRNEQAMAHSRLGDINRLLGNYAPAQVEYGESISSFTQLAKQYPNDPGFRRSLAYAHNWLGETIRAWLKSPNTVSAPSRSDAEKEYTTAINLQSDLAREYPSDAIYRQELARSYYNRGIVGYEGGKVNDAKADFGQAIALLEPMVASSDKSSGFSDNPNPKQDLARVYNDDAILKNRSGDLEGARLFYSKAIVLAEQSLRDSPENREYQSELANYSSNLARMLTESADPELAKAPAARAVQLIENLASPTRSIKLRLAEALQLEGRLSIWSNPTEAKAHTDRALAVMEGLDATHAEDRAVLSAIYRSVAANYLQIAQEDLKLGKPGGSREAIDGFNAVLPHLPLNERNFLLGPYKALEGQLSSAPKER